MDLEMIIISEVRQKEKDRGVGEEVTKKKKKKRESKKDQYHMISLICGI